MLSVEFNRIYTLSFQEAQQYKIPKEVNLNVIKDENTRKWVAINGSWLRLYAKHQWRFYLPPSAYEQYQHGTVVCPLITIEYDNERLYPFQAQAIDAMYEYLAKGKWYFIRSWTGTGKTEMICGIVDRLKTRTVIVAPTRLIAWQISAELSQYTDKVGIAEWKDIAKRMSEFIQHDILVCTHMTFNDNFDVINGNFELLIMDEWHHVPPRRVQQFALWKWRYIVGLSANRKRKDIAAEHFPKIYGGYYDTEQESLPVQILKYVYPHTYSFEDIQNATEWYAPDSPEIRRRLLIANPDRVKKLTSIIDCLHMKWIRKIIVFVDRKEYCYQIVEELKKTQDNIIEMMSGDHDNIAVKAALKDKAFYIIVAMEQCVREGMNIPDLEAGVLFFSTSEENTINQISWRVRRAHGFKKVWYMVDFVDVIDIAWTKKKVLGYYNRKQIYDKFGFEVLDFNQDTACWGNLFDGLEAEETNQPIVNSMPDHSSRLTSVESLPSTPGGSSSMIQTPSADIS